MFLPVYFSSAVSGLWNYAYAFRPCKGRSEGSLPKQSCDILFFTIFSMDSFRIYSKLYKMYENDLA